MENNIDYDALETCNLHAYKSEELLEEANDALYAAKRYVRHEWTNSSALIDYTGMTSEQKRMANDAYGKYLESLDYIANALKEVDKALDAMADCGLSIKDLLKTKDY